MFVAGDSEVPTEFDLLLLVGAVFGDAKRAARPGATGLLMLPVRGFGKGGNILLGSILVKEANGVAVSASSSLGVVGIAMDTEDIDDELDGVLRISSGAG